MILSFSTLRATKPVKGVFVILKKGEKVGTETFTCVRDREWRVIGESVLLGPSERIVSRYTCKYSRNLVPLYYEVEKKKVGSREFLALEYKKGKLKVRRESEGKLEEKEFKVKDDFILLDQNIFGHLYVLYEKLKKKKFVSSLKINVFVPQLMFLKEASAVKKSNVLLLRGKERFWASRIVVDFGSFTVELYAKRGRLIGGRVPYADIFFYRKDIYPRGFELGGKSGYVEKEITIYSRGASLSGTLTLPEKKKPLYPAVLFIVGSGPLDRNGNAENFVTDFFKDIAHCLALSGIASLRYDKRGVGKSSGVFENVSMRDLVADGLAALRYLEGRKKLIDKDKIFVLGHSEGGVIAAQIVLLSKARGLILVATPLRPLDSLIIWQIKRTAEIKGISEEEAQLNVEKNQEFFKFIRGSKGEWGDYRPQDVEGYRKSFSLRWWREHLSLHPAQVFQRVKCPVLIMHGKLDPQVPYEDAKKMAIVIKKGGNKDVEYHIFDKLNHFMKQEEKPVAPREQNFIGPLDEEFLKTLKSWLRKHI